MTSAPALQAEGSAFDRSIGAFVLQRYSVVYPVAFLLTAVVMILLTLNLTAVERLSQENQVIENMTVVLYGLAILWLVLGGNGDRLFRYQSAFLLAVMAARELSFQKAFTTESMTRTSYWIRSEAPLSEKLMAGAVALFVIYYVLRYLATHHRRLWQGLREGRCHAVSIVAAAMLVPVSKILDSTSRVLRDKFSMPVPDDIGDVMGLFEEMLELGIPLVVLWALWQVALGADRRSLRDSCSKT
ncbi:hypothetical protein [Rhodospirillaceae bacterium SYSU D60014]|uniref:hypothetical protein n=1 Tax=Virgifigura deserti TaxID=2268457 RepID=UPI000E6674E1